MRIPMFEIMLILAGMFLGMVLDDHLTALRKADREFIVSPAALYQSDNELYFNNKLPKAEVVAAESPDGDDVYGVTVHTPGTNYYKIFISPKNNDSMSLERGTVLHEACHTKVWSDAEANGTIEEYQFKDHHGKEFQDCMKTLARKDAFASIW
jgi:hypothetical protein